MSEGPKPLNYANPPRHERAPVVRRALYYALAGVPLTLIAMGLAINTATRENHLAAKLLFPYMMLAVRATRDESYPVLFATIAQFPLYAAICGAAAAARGRIWKVVGILAVVHAVAVLVCLSVMARDS